ncbi:FliH/SctL family protein [Stakelama marina]|uniref:Flagellar assembly protein FliH n=1 Tax=Stakelama marina TaxID=2826939 RepID=A0A8T4I7H1_9SPHN|nr:FliH/SctL family protein [Stakelama marina]MBR0550938.1 flagellar assembly protein FliH [Stakelama marina]
MDTSFQVKPFGFDRVFAEPERRREYRRKTDASDLAIEVEALRAELNALRQSQQDELARVRTEAFEAGLDHARTERDAAILSSLDALQASLEAVSDQRDELVAEYSSDAAELALVAADTLAGHAVRLEPGRTIDEAIGRVLSQVARGQEVHVTVHPDLLDDIERRVEARQANDRRRLFLSVSADPNVAPGDAVLVWERGGVTLDAAARRAAVMTELEPLLKRGDG